MNFKEAFLDELVKIALNVTQRAAFLSSLKGMSPEARQQAKKSFAQESVEGLKRAPLGLQGQNPSSQKFTKAMEGMAARRRAAGLPEMTAAERRQAGLNIGAEMRGPLDRGISEDRRRRRQIAFRTAKNRDALSDPMGTLGSGSLREPLTMHGRKQHAESGRGILADIAGGTNKNNPGDPFNPGKGWRSPAVRDAARMRMVGKLNKRFPEVASRVESSQGTYQPKPISPKAPLRTVDQGQAEHGRFEDYMGRLRRIGKVTGVGNLQRLDPAFNRPSNFGFEGGVYNYR